MSLEWDISETRKFSEGTLRDLRRNNAVVYNPEETVLRFLRIAGFPRNGRKFRYRTSVYDEWFTGLLLEPSQVAIFPDPEQFYVPLSNDLSSGGQRLAQITDMEEVVNKKMGIGGIESVMGDLPTHAGLIIAHLDKTDRQVYLHGKNYGKRTARTETRTINSETATVSWPFARLGVEIGSYPLSPGNSNLWVVRLGVPVQE